SQLARFPNPRKQTSGCAEPSKFTPWKEVNVIDVAISAQQRRPFRIDDPGDFGVGISITNRRDRWKSVNDIPERTRFDDQDFRRHELATERQTVGEQTRQPGGDNFFAGLFDGVANTALLDQIFVGVVNAIGGAPITIARLSDTAGVNEIFFARFTVHLFLLGAAGAGAPTKSALIT